MKIYRRKNNILLAILICVIIGLYPAICLGKTYTINIVNPLRANDVPTLIKDLTNYILAITGSIMLIMLIIAGYRYMTAGGNEQRAENAKKAIKWTVVGILVILVSGIVINSLINALRAP